MKIIVISALAILIVASAAATTASLAQDAAPAPMEAAGPSLTQPQLEQLVAPVALYDDPLLADVLTASTYPLEVVEAHRWLADPANAALKGDALASALDDKDWDPSVKALIPFPQVIETMDGHLDWTENLGEAFLSQEDEVMDAVQQLRHRAESAGTLKSSPQQTVADDAGDVTISPPPEAIYVPEYDPWCAYGPWPLSGLRAVRVRTVAGLLRRNGLHDRLRRRRLPALRVLGLGLLRLAPSPYRDSSRSLRPVSFGPSVGRRVASRSGAPHRRALPHPAQRPAISERAESGSGLPRLPEQRRRTGAGRAPEPPAYRDFGSGQDTHIQSQRGQISRQGLPHGGGGGFGMPHGGGMSGGGGMSHGGGGHGGRP